MVDRRPPFHPAFERRAMMVRGARLEHDHVRVERRGLGEVSPDRGLGHVIDNDADKSAPGTIRVEAVSVDEYVRQSGAPDFIKCDVEGAEVEVFRGANKLLNERRPFILCEMHGDKNRQTLLKMFENLGYRCEPCGENHILAQHKN